MAAIACGLQEYVGVFVPAEDKDAQTLSNLLVVQRACDASIILIDVEVWNGLSAALKDRYVSVARSVDPVQSLPRSCMQLVVAL
ncbi:MAG: hypothetical protein HC767_13040 [Akkermansiaceae bacterium]|nr:hypothetical protein [Akkermansiaceae bacterium]